MPSELPHPGICHSTSWHLFKRTVLFLKREGQIKLDFDQLSVSCCMRWVNTVRGVHQPHQDPACNTSKIAGTLPEVHCRLIGGLWFRVNNPVLTTHSQYDIPIVLFRLTTDWWASSIHLPPIMFIEFSPRISFCDSFLLLMLIVCVAGFYFQWIFLL